MGAQTVGYLRNVISNHPDLTDKTKASITMRRDLIISALERLLSNIKATGVSELLLDRLPGRGRSDEPRLSEALDIYGKLILYRSTAGEAEQMLITEFNLAPLFEPKFWHAYLGSDKPDMIEQIHDVRYRLNVFSNCTPTVVKILARAGDEALGNYNLDKSSTRCSMEVIGDFHVRQPSRSTLHR